MSLPRPTDETTALITGASAGIGAELARALAARGHHVTLVARREDRLRDLRAELKRRYGTEARIDACDLGDREARARLVASLRRRRRRVALLVNNAGFGTYGRFWELPPEREREEVRVNVEALHDLTVELVPGMVERRSGAVLNVASTAAFQPLPRNATYAATKAFVLSLSEALHAELDGTGVVCTVVCPGPVETEFQSAAGIGRVSAETPGLFWGSPEEVARAALDGLAQGKRVVLPRPTDKLQGALGRFAPRSVLLPVMRRAGDRLPRG